MLFYLETNSKFGKFTCQRLWNIHGVPTCRYRLLAYIATICKKFQHNTLILFIYDFICCFDDHVMLYDILARFEFRFTYLLHLVISVAWQAWHISNRSGTKFISFHVYMRDNLTCTSKYLCPFLSFSRLPSLLKRIHIDLSIVVRSYLLGSHTLILTEW